MIGIVVALKSEIKYFLENITPNKIYNFYNKKVFEFSLNNNNCVLIISGIGKVNSALSTQFLIDKYNVKTIINIGTCGCLDKNANIGDIFSVDRAIQFDFDLTELDNVPIGYIQDYDTNFFKTTNKLNFQAKTLASLDKFSKNEEDINKMINLGVCLKDMEGASILQVTTTNNVESIMLKVVSDIYGKQEMTKQYYKNLDYCSSVISDNLMKIISNDNFV